MVGLVRRSFPAAAAAMLMLAGCAPRLVEAPVTVAAEAPPVPPPPTLPAGIPATMNVPPVGADGAYLTLNHGVDAAEAIWHVRSALNVAALACRGPQETGIIAAYNALLKGEGKALAAALKAVQAHYKAEHGKSWQDVHDSHMTRVYNFFAQPAAQQRFCVLAAAVLAEANAAAPADFPAFAAAALPRLEAPFTDVYRAFDGYRRDLAAWQARYGPAQAPATQVAARSPEPVPALAPAAVAAPEVPTRLGFNRR